MRAIISKWRGSYGFATPDDLSHPDIFIHESMLPESAGARRINLIIECDLVAGLKGGRPMAVSVRVIDAGGQAAMPTPPAATIKLEPVTPRPVDARPVPPKIAALLDLDNGDDGIPKRKSKRDRKFGH